MSRSIKLLTIINLLLFVAVKVMTHCGADGCVGHIVLEWPNPRPWTLLSYMFLQSDGWELSFNMMWLWIVGAMTRRQPGASSTWGAYLAGGAFGGASYLLCCSQGIVQGGMLTGASASIIGMMTCIACSDSKAAISFPMFHSRKVTVRTLFTAITAIAVICPMLTDTATAAAHAGGAVGGIAAATTIKLLKKSKATSDPETKRILEKIKTSGYSSLSADQRQRLIRPHSK